MNDYPNSTYQFNAENLEPDSTYQFNAENLEPDSQERVEVRLRDVMNFHTKVCELRGQIEATRAHLDDLLARVVDSNNNLDEAMRMLLAETNETRRIVNQMVEPEPVAEKARRSRYFVQHQQEGHS